jgi:hypothetical protein
MKITDKIRKHAEKIIYVKSDKDIPFKGLPLIECKAYLKYNGFYTCVYKKKKTLFISKNPITKLPKIKK